MAEERPRSPEVGTDPGAENAALAVRSLAQPQNGSAKTTKNFLECLFA